MHVSLVLFEAHLRKRGCLGTLDQFSTSQSKRPLLVLAQGWQLSRRAVNAVKEPARHDDTNDRMIDAEAMTHDFITGNDVHQHSLMMAMQQ